MWRQCTSLTTTWYATRSTLFLGAKQSSVTAVCFDCHSRFALFLCFFSRFSKVCGSNSVIRLESFFCCVSRGKALGVLWALKYTAVASFDFVAAGVNRRSRGGTGRLYTTPPGEHALSTLLSMNSLEV